MSGESAKVCGLLRDGMICLSAITEILGLSVTSMENESREGPWWGKTWREKAAEVLA